MNTTALFCTVAFFAVALLVIGLVAYWPRGR